MSIMGWSDSGMAKRYQHLTAQVRRDVAPASVACSGSSRPRLPMRPTTELPEPWRGPTETEIETGTRNARRLTQSRRAFALLDGGGEGI